MAEKVVLVLDLEKGDFNKPFKELIDEAEKSGTEAGKKSSRKFNKSFKFDSGKLGKELARISTIAVAAGAALASVFTVKSIQLANQQEDAIKRLNTSLQVAGDFSQKASQDIQDFAAELQTVTRFGDEAILNQVALAKSFGATNEQAKQIAKTATDLSEALGIDLESATRNVAKTLGGYAGELGETIPQLKAFTTAQLQAGAGVDILAQKFAGTAQQQVKTFSGGLAQLSNSFGDLLEEFGFLITKSPAVNQAIQSVNKVVLDLSERLKNFSKGFNITTDVVFPLLGIADAINGTVVPAFELLFNVGKIAINGIKSVFFGFLSAFNSGILKVTNLYGKLTGDTSFSDTIRDNIKVLDGEFNTAVANSSKAVDGLFDGSFGEGIQTKIEETRAFFTEIEAQALATSTKIAETQTKTVEKSKEQVKTFGDFLKGTGDQFSGFFGNINNATQAQIKETNKTVQQFAVNTAKALKNGIGVAAGNAFASFGAALVNGENALEAFGKAFLKQIANIAVQQGTQFILQGVGYLFVPGFQSLGTQLIAAGAGLAAFGGALGAVSGGGGGGVGGGGVGAQADIQTSSFSSDSETTSPEEAERREESTNVSLVIQGDVLDSEETGTRIAGILSTAFEKDGIVLNEGATA